MTILTIDPPSANESLTHTFTNVKSCSDCIVTLYNGTQYAKRLCAKVKILSVEDAPDDFDGFQRFFESIGYKDRKYIPMKKDEFVNLEELTHI